MGTTSMLLGLGLVMFAVFFWGYVNPESGLGKMVYTTFGLQQPVWVKRRLTAREKAAERQLVELTTPIDRDQQLRTVQVGNFFTVMGKTMGFKAKMLLLELKYFGNDKADKRHVAPDGSKLREFPAYMVGKQLLLEQPMKEEGSLSWFLYQNVTDQLQGFSAYLKGSEANPGPGVLFAQSNQQGTVHIEAFGKRYMAKDLVWADIDLQQVEKFFLRKSSNGDKPRVVMLLAQCEDDGEYLLSIDLRSGEGSDTVWIGRPFDPDVEIEDM